MGELYRYLAEQIRASELREKERAMQQAHAVDDSTEIINIEGLDRVDVFLALYSHAGSDPNPELCDDPYEPGELPYAVAKEMVDLRDGKLIPYYSLVRCRRIHVTLMDDELWAARYNQYNGAGVAQKIVAALRKIKGIPEPEAE